MTTDKRLLPPSELLSPPFPSTTRFELVRCLGRGGMGVVYEAVDRARGARVALKTIHHFTAEGLLRFKNELRALQDLQHPNLVRLDELFEVLALVQTGKMRRVPIICFDRRYWTEVIHLETLAKAGMISQFDPDLVAFADDAEEAWSILLDRGLRVPEDLPVAAGGLGELPRTVRAGDDSP